MKYSPQHIITLAKSFEVPETNQLLTNAPCFQKVHRAVESVPGAPTNFTFLYYIIGLFCEKIGKQHPLLATPHPLVCWNWLIRNKLCSVMNNPFTSYKKAVVIKQFDTAPELSHLKLGDILFLLADNGNVHCAMVAQEPLNTLFTIETNATNVVIKRNRNLAHITHLIRIDYSLLPNIV